MSSSKRNNAKSPGQDSRWESEHPGPLLRQALQKCRGVHVLVCNDLDITSMQTSAIYTLNEMGAISQATLGKAIVMEPPNVHGLVKRLLQKDIITLNSTDNDARANIIELTAKGKKLAKIIKLRSVQVKERFLAPLNKKEQKLLRELLERLVDTP
jgi:DNA-binding MarR family transcriptional regulator